MSLLSTTDEYAKRIIRTALLNAQSEWLMEADRAESVTARTIAVVIADAFSQEAGKYKTKETSFYDIDKGEPVGSWLDESAAAGEVPHAGEAG